MPRRLVVNADDLGLSPGVNRGIFDAHDRGILTSASLFANAGATRDAIRGIGSRPSLGIGVHLALVDGEPALAPRLVPTLVDGGGRFRPSWKPFVADCVRGRVALHEVERELAAQIARVRSAGIEPTHLDAHKHVHMYPPVFAIVARLAKQFGIPVVRVPYERWSAFRVDRSGTAPRQALLNVLMLPWARRNYRTAAALGLRAPAFVGRAHTGVLSAASLRELLQRLKPGVTELMVHPGYVDAALLETATRLRVSRAEEVRLLCSAETREALAGERIQLACHDVSHPAPRSLRHGSLDRRSSLQRSGHAR